ncbi:YceD family protein [Catalinimonas niigatensis]|uniref:YceD family protein n=1 Tax=Catalinimonas niigatensis TaxID=1397264 RepID=UPI0026653EBE|nr:DUF177 domain-containing protein [Catalinimonas niigatensis]WPP48318.1 DUF177 domain-containing protein [Catalinimonas niigatensis]
MKNLAHFDIDIYKLANKQYKYQYQIDKSFFDHFENSPVEKGDLRLEVTFDKQENLITVLFDIKGSVELECDRSLEKFDYPVEIHERVLYQYGEEEQELSDEIIIITNDTQKINVAQHIYEFIILSVPMRKIHPKYAEEENPFVEGEIIFSSSTGHGSEKDSNEEDESSVDPRWDALKNLKNLN